MKNFYKNILLLVIVLAIATITWQGFFVQQKYFILYDRKNETTVLKIPVKAGDHLKLEIEHSFEHIPWFEYYTILPDDSFNLDKIEVAGYGAGIPAEMSVPTKIENGLVVMENINSNFPILKWITSNIYMKGLQLNGVEIFDFRSLPDASLIKGEIITMRGVFFN